jgi:hypothetical protein
MNFKNEDEAHEAFVAASKYLDEAEKKRAEKAMSDQEVAVGIKATLGLFAISVISMGSMVVLDTVIIPKLGWQQRPLAEFLVTFVACTVLTKIKWNKGLVALISDSRALFVHEENRWTH